MPLRRSKRDSRNQAVQRYEKQKRRNLLATPGAHDFVIVLDHLKAGFNVPKIFRSAEAFGAREVHLINIGMFDPAPGKGSFKKVPARFYESFEESYQQLKREGYQIFMLAAEQGTPLQQCQLPEKAAFIFGHEERGHSFDVEQFEDISSLSIPQFGQVESLNVSVAASIVMYEYCRHWGKSVPAKVPMKSEQAEVQGEANLDTTATAQSKIRRKKSRLPKTPDNSNE